MWRNVWERAKGPATAIAVSIFAVVLAIAVSMIFVAVQDSSPAEALGALFEGAFGSRPQFANTLTKWIPLVLLALGWIVAFSAKRLNIGLEGQALMGGAAATGIGISVGLPLALHLGIAIVGGALAGAAFAGIAAWLWARRGVNEIISTLLLNLVAVQIVGWLIRGPFGDETARITRSEVILDTAQWPVFLSGTPLAWDILLVPIAVVVIWLLLRRTDFGYSLRLTGANEAAARMAGVKTVRTTVIALLVSGALAGLAGSSLVLASQTHIMTDNFTAGVGFTGIVVALVARNNVWGVLPAAFLFAVLAQGGGLMEARTGVSADLVGVIQALVILAVAGSAFLLDRRRRVRVDEPHDEAPADTRTLEPAS